MEEKGKQKKKRSIFLYFLGMAGLFLLFFLLSQYLTLVVHNSMDGLKYSEDTLFEIIWAGFALILLLLYKNKYVFTQERDSFTSTLKYTIPTTILSVIFLISSIIYGIESEVQVSFLSVLNLLIYCFFIGIVEEFLCRGWLLNEFLERFSDSKKNIVLSIVFSSLIFGLIHFLNIGETQGFIDTLIQVLNATSLGIFFALVYYKTKNIWTVVFIHAFWDFSLIYSELYNEVDCFVAGSTTSSIVLYSIVTGILVIIGLLLMAFWVYRKTDLSNKEENPKYANYFMIAGIFVYLITMFVIQEPKDFEQYYSCPIYEHKDVKGEYIWSYSLISEYNMEFFKEEPVVDTLNENNETTLEDTNVETNVDPNEGNNSSFNFTLSENSKTYEVEFKNNLTNEKVVLAELANDYLLVENEDSFSILIQNSENSVLYGYFEKNAAMNGSTYLDVVKNSLKEYKVPPIDLINTLEMKEKNYKYASIRTKTYQRMIFEKNEEPYFAEIAQ